MKNIIRLLALSLLFTIGAGAQWMRTPGPDGGQVGCIGVDGTSLFAGTSGGGLFLSTNSGASWSPANTGLPVNRVQAFCASGGTIFTGTWGGGIYISTNGGVSWTFSSAGLQSGDVRCLAASGGSVYAGTYGAGVFVSTDGGATWSASNSGLTSTVIWAFTSSGTSVFAATDGGAFVSTDGGASWNAVPNGLTNTHVLSIAVIGTHVFAGTDGGGVYRTTDDGLLWTQVDSGLAVTSVYALAVSSPGLYAATWGGVFVSTDEGTSWSAASTGLTKTDVRTLATEGGAVFAGTNGGNGVYRTSDGGASWSAASSGLAAATIRAFASGASGTFAATDDHGVYLRTTGGAGWTPVNTGLTNTNIRSLAVSGGNTFAGTEGGGVFLSTNDGASWSAAGSGLTASSIRALLTLQSAGALALKHRGSASPGASVFAGTEAGVFLSTDNGTSWSAASTGLTSSDILSLGASGTNLFAGTNGAGIFLSTDNGSLWNAVNSGLGELHVRAIASVAGEIFAGTDGGVFRSTTGGSLWSAVDTGLTTAQILSLSVSGTNLFAGTAGGGVFLLTYQSTNWSSISTGLGNVTVQAFTALPHEILAGTTGSSVWTRASSEVITTQFMLTVTAAHGSVSRSPDIIVYDSLTVVQLTPAPDTGYHFVEWTGDLTGSVVPGSLMMNGDKNVTANFAKDQFALTVTALNGTVERNPDLPLYDTGSVVQLQARPATGYHFTGWTGDVTDTVNPVSITMNSPKSVTANFAIDRYALTITAVNGTVAKVPDLALYDSATVVHCTAHPAGGYHFTGWSGDLSGSLNPDSITMNRPKAVTALFALDQFALTITAVNGTVAKVPDLPLYDSATVVRLTAHPAGGYHFTGWSGDLSGSHNPDSVTMNQPRAVTALFALKQFTLTVTAVNGNVVKSPDRASYDSGTVVHLTAEPAPGCYFLNWTGDLTGSANPDSIRMNAAHTVTANFRVIMSTTTGWNLVSAPVRASDPRKVSLFPASTSAAYAYQNGYLQKDTLQHGTGYWLKFPLTSTITFGGQEVLADTFVLAPRWNIVGSLDVPLSVASIVSDPPGMVLSQFISFRADSGYRPVDTLMPGKGYWVRASTAGRLLLHAGTEVSAQGKPAARIRIVVISEPPPAPPEESSVARPAIPSEFALHQNYPNPFNPGTTIGFALPRETFVDLRVYDMLGRVVATLISETRKTGEYRLRWEAGALPSGLYFYRLKAGDFIQTRKLLLVK